MEKEEKLTGSQLFWYFLIFSILGLLIETFFCYATVGVLESRKGLLWGPFCPVYGVSATILIICLNKYKQKNIFQLFLYGFLIGSIAEYILSFALEAIYGIRFWEYEYFNFNLNGRICMRYSFYWGILSVILMKLIKPILDLGISKINQKLKKGIEVIVFLFLVVDCFMTIWGIQTYQNRVIYHKVNNQQTNNIIVQVKQKIENEYFTNERISQTFPNLRVKDENGNEVWIKTLIDKPKELE